ncbi:PIR Superfamily Protein [Plasmodium ovale curtisi]|uniref:PIR Superfamily Protein n=1 Tax=Plasmodium ovale curtisi TaxID=864141 RepID=A0A1A8WGC5_PLAOA|nr:PIR Superfamily Protein [Plasmodium ovale curtisi]
MYVEKVIIIKIFFLIIPLVKSLRYWFYQKLITDNIYTEGINEINTNWKRQMNAFSNSIRIPSKFHANTLEDVKIIKVLYDHILFPSIRKKENVLKGIEKCEFCDYFKNNVQDFIIDNKNTCPTASPYVFCMEHNDHLKISIDLNDVLSLTHVNTMLIIPTNINTKKLLEKKEGKSYL